MSCGGKRTEAPAPKPGFSTTGGSPPVVRVPVGRGSSLMTNAAPLLKPGFTRYKPAADIAGIGGRGIAPTSRAAEPDTSKARGTIANGSRGALGRPGQEPSTTQPLHLARRNPAHRWNDMHPIRMGVGDATPIDGRERVSAHGLPGGRPLPMEHTYTRVAHLMPLDLYSRERWADFNLAVRHARVEGKRPVLLLAGPSPLEHAQAPRFKPGTPSLVQGAGPQFPLRPNALRGRRAEQDKAPRDILEQVARDAAASLGGR